MMARSRSAVGDPAGRFTTSATARIDRQPSRPGPAVSRYASERSSSTSSDQSTSPSRRATRHARRNVDSRRLIVLGASFRASWSALNPRAIVLAWPGRPCDDQVERPRRLEPQVPAQRRDVLNPGLARRVAIGVGEQGAVQLDAGDAVGDGRRAGRPERDDFRVHGRTLR